MQTIRELIDRFFSSRTGISIPDVKPGQVAVATCDRRTYAELGYGYTSLLMMLHFGDRAVISVHPAVLAEVSRWALRKTPEEVGEAAFLQKALDLLRELLPQCQFGDKPGGGSVVFYHPGNCEPVATEGSIRCFTPADAAGCRAAWAGERVYMHAAEHSCVEEGEAFGLFLGDKLIADVMTHEPSVQDMAEVIAEDGIEVAAPYHRRGYGKAILAAWTRAMQEKGKACIHSTSFDNIASIALAKSVGYVEYAHKRGITI
jgi:hypothetical protein